MKLKAAIVRAVACLLISAPVAEGKEVKTLAVDCGKGESLAVALDTKADELIVEFTGVCFEDVVVVRDNTTIRGAAPGAEIVGSELPETLFGGGVSVVGASNVTLADFTVRDSRRGVSVLHGGAANLERLVLRDNLKDGLMLWEGAHATVTDCQMVDNDSRGIGVWNGSHLAIRSNLTVSGNGRLGLLASGNSSLGTAGLGTIEIDANGLYGLALQVGATGQLRGGEILIRGSLYGIVVFYTGELLIGAEVSGNSFTGAYVGFRSYLNLDGPVTDNGVFGIYGEQEASVDFSGELSGHGLGLFLDGSIAFIRNATSGDPVDLVFGTRVDFAGNNSFTGYVSCDETVLVRGDVACAPLAASPAAATKGLEAGFAPPSAPLELEP